MFIGLVVFTLYPRKAVVEFELPDFQSKLVSDLTDWTWEDRPVAESEELVKAIGQQLAFDDGLYRVYQRDGVGVAVWAAYWRPGKVDIRDVQWHVPDSCWVHGGWNIDRGLDDYSLSFPDGRRLVSGKYRLMAKPSGKVHVVFWHLVGGKNLKITRGAGSLIELPEIIRQTGFQSQEGQYFFRISSTHAFEDLMTDPDFRKIVEGVARLGLFGGETEARGQR